MATLTDVDHRDSVRSATGAAMLCTLALLTYGNLVSIASADARQSFLLWTNLIVGALLLLWAVWQKLSADEIGLAWRSVKSSAVVGAALSLAVALPPVAFILVTPLITGEPIQNNTTEQSGLGMVYFVLFRQPLGTAFFEEFAFRGVLYGAWMRAGGERLAFLATSIAFALWHVVITTKTVAESDVVDSPPLIAIGVLVSMVGLFAGGMIFAYLRWRTGSIAAPAVAHWLIIALMTTAIWLVG